jgi:nifR3 family TIM-barrel protein
MNQEQRLTEERQSVALRIAQGGAVLAPMAGYSDAPFRRLSEHFGAAWSVTEMVSARALALGDRRSPSISAPYPGEQHVVVQLFASDPDEAAVAAERLHRTFNLGGLDLNMGCPVPKVVQRGCGVELMRDPERAAAIVRSMRAAVPLPVSVKTRLGIDRMMAAEVGAAVAEAGAAALAIHGRTAMMRYQGEADWDAIADIARQLPLPVVGSGDVRDRASFEAARARGLGVMVARGAIGRPWLFAELRGEAPPDPMQMVAIIWRHARDHVDWYGSERSLLRLRSQLGAYAEAAGVKRDPFVRVETLEQLAQLLVQQLDHDPRSEALLQLDPLSGPIGSRVAA